MHSQEKWGGVVPRPLRPLPSLQGAAPLSPVFRALTTFFHAHPFFNAFFQPLFQRRKLWKYNDLRHFLPFFLLFHDLFIYIHISIKFSVEISERSIKNKKEEGRNIFIYLSKYILYIYLHIYIIYILCVKIGNL